MKTDWYVSPNEHFIRGSLSVAIYVYDSELEQWYSYDGGNEVPVSSLPAPPSEMLPLLVGSAVQFS